MEETKRILLRVPNWVGDAVMTLPALEALRRLYPGAEITVLARKTVIPVYERHPAVADIMEYGEEFRSLGGRFRLSARLRSRRFHLAVLFQNAFDAAFLSFISRIPERVGYGRDMRSGLLTRAIPFTEESRRLHHIEYYLNIIRALGPVKIAPGARPVLYIGEDETRHAGDFLEKMGVPEGSALAGVAPGAAYGPAKRWGEERFAEALSSLTEELGGAALIFGGPGDVEAAEKVFEGTSDKAGPVLNLAGQTTLRQCMALMKRLSVFITNDSGAMHLAAALGVPTVAIFGSTDPALTGPRGEKTRVVIKKTECSPCFERVCKHGHMECMKAVTVDDVLEAARDLLREGKAG
jgi:heptosyltransferase-2